MKLETLTYPALLEGKDVKFYTFTNDNGASVTVSNLGAAIVSVCLPEKNGKMTDVVLGYKDPKSWLADGPCAGKVPGRFANRIAKGKFTLDEREYTLAVNNGPNALHGGPTGFQNHVWDGHVLPDASGVEMTYHAKDGEEGYPGNLTVKALYTWNDKCELTLRLTAETDAPTVVNLTNHAYFNLDGENSGTVLDHTLKLEASRWLPTDSTQIPTGELAPVKGTPMDFTEFKKIGKDINEEFEALKIGKGYDHCFVLDEGGKGKLVLAATLKGAKKGHTLEVYTTQPGLQVYTGNWLKGCPESKSGKEYEDYAGVALECQNFPDAPNKPEFPSSVLRPGETFDETIRFKFS